MNEISACSTSILQPPFNMDTTHTETGFPGEMLQRATYQQRTRCTTTTWVVDEEHTDVKSDRDANIETKEMSRERAWE